MNKAVAIVLLLTRLHNKIKLHKEIGASPFSIPFHLLVMSADHVLIGAYNVVQSIK